MNRPELFDVIELLTDIPEFSLRKGETTALCSICHDKFTIVWCAKTEQWLTPIIPR